MEAIADTYRALLPEGSGVDFQRILDLKVSDVLYRFPASQDCLSLQPLLFFDI